MVCLLFVDQLVDHLLVSSGEESRGLARDLAFLAQLGVLTAQPGQFGLVVAGGAFCLAGIDLGLLDPGADGLSRGFELGCRPSSGTQGGLSCR